jgi:PAS domain S-box-containing protein
MFKKTDLGFPAGWGGILNLSGFVPHPGLPQNNNYDFTHYNIRAAGFLLPHLTVPLCRNTMISEVNCVIQQNCEPLLLLVDNDRNSLDNIFSVLENEKYKIAVAANGGNAIRMAEKLLPDMILLDVQLPDTDAFTVCRKLKSSAETEKIPVMFMASPCKTVDTAEGFQSGGIDCITKPFETDELTTRIRTHLEMKKLREALREERNRFLCLTEMTSEGIVMHDKGYITEISRTAEKITGYSIRDLKNKKIHELFMPEFRDLLHESIGTESEQVYEAPGRKKDGTSVCLRVKTKKMLYRGKETGILVLRDIRHEKEPEIENRKLRSMVQEGRFGNMVGTSPVMKKVYEEIIRASLSDETLMISGETGTGKELAARMVFEISRKYKRTFVSVNCASVPESLFESQFFGYCKGAFTGADRDMPGFIEQARAGTLFLDEIGELKPQMQAKLLRVIQNGEYMPVGSSSASRADIRIIAASNRDIGKMVREGNMRADFFHRLNVIHLTMPPLRNRKEDIPMLVESFLSQKIRPGNSPPHISEKTIRQLYDYDWPGNVRELFNVLRRYLVDGRLNPGDSLSPAESDIPFLTKELPLKEAVEAFEEFYIRRILDCCKGKKKQAAEILNLNRRTLYNKLNKS